MTDIVPGAFDVKLTPQLTANSYKLEYAVGSTT